MEREKLLKFLESEVFHMESEGGQVCAVIDADDLSKLADEILAAIQ